MEEFLTDHWVIIAAAAVFCIGAAIALFSKKKDKWVTGEEFERQKSQLRTHCSEEEFNRFMEFLKGYEGGFVRRKNGSIVQRGYLGKEKGDLKGIFYNIIAPNPNLHTSQKEEFRRFIVSKGVSGLNERPAYEIRDSKLRNNETDEDERERKNVGNIGESIIREVLRSLNGENDAVINGAKLKYGDTVKEYDHIIVRENGVFVIETKAFGMTDGNSVRASLFIDEGDKWILRKNNKNRELTSPTQQINEEVAHLKNIIRSCRFKITPIVALSNKEIMIKQNIQLPYLVKRADQIIDAIRSTSGLMTEETIRLILHDIDESRIN